ncbi:hypothetical protein KEJ32_04070 [Candidatus Bathyarchaeota archaeon]|nr:hypothetical protein [Candidatus Bathyarchaeota archaeon]
MFKNAKTGIITAKTLSTRILQELPKPLQPTETRFQNCILCLIADELTRTRQLLQQRTQHQTW